MTYRYGRGSILITIEKSVRDWTELLAGDEVPTAAILDRLLHDAHVIDIKGRSYRLRDLDHALGERAEPCTRHDYLSHCLPVRCAGMGVALLRKTECRLTGCRYPAEGHRLLRVQTEPLDNDQNEGSGPIQVVGSRPGSRRATTDSITDARTSLPRSAGSAGR